MQMGHVCFCPISHSHTIDRLFPELASLAFWKKQDKPFIDFCDEVWVANIPGWDKSKGVAWEIREAKKAKKPVWLVDAFAVKVKPLSR